MSDQDTPVVYPGEEVPVPEVDPALDDPDQEVEGFPEHGEEGEEEEGDDSEAE